MSGQKDLRSAPDDPPTSPITAKIRILPVEDERIVARDLQLRLRKLGYEVADVASSKDEAIEMARTGRPDLVLMDIRLNGVPEGIDAAREIRDRFDIPIIYLTAHSDYDTLEQAKDTEPFGYILKPFEDREIMAAVETAVHKHKAEKRLRATERWLAATLSSIADAVIATDGAAHVSFLNAVAEKLTGWATADAVGRDLVEVFRVKERKKTVTTEHLLWRAFREGGSLSDQTVLVSRDGSPTLISFSIAPIRDEGDERTGMVLVFRDVSDREKTARELLTRSQQQAAASQFGQRALERLDVRALVEEACALIKRHLNVDLCGALELLPDQETLMLRAGSGWKDGRVGAATIIIRRLEAGDDLESSGLAVPGNSKREERFLNSPLLVEHGARSGASVVIGGRDQPYGVLGAYCRSKRSFTASETDFLLSIANILGSAIARKKMEAALEAANLELRDQIERRKEAEEQLFQVQKMDALGRMAGGVAHDFNNLLTVIGGYNSMLRSELDDPKLTAYANEVQNATEQAAALTRQLLAVGRGQMRSAAVLDLNETIRQIETMLRHAVGEEIDFITRFSAISLRIVADPEHIQQVILNLVMNAREAMPSGGTLVMETGEAVLSDGDTNRRIGAAPGRYVLLAISDTGVGIGPEEKKRLFEPFFTTKPRAKGTGLGLSIVYGIVSQSGGDISVASEPGMGTTVRVYFPVSGPQR